jgi:uncharacterized protein
VFERRYKFAAVRGDAGFYAGGMADPTVGSEPVAGWYRDDNGYVRWWNGRAWDDRPPAPRPPPPSAPGYGAPGAGGPGYGPPAAAPGFYGPPPGPGAYGPGPGFGGWSPGAPAPGRADGRSMAMLSHLGAFVGGFILPLIIYLTVGKEDPFVRHHASESLNFQLTYLMLFLGGFVLGFATLGLGFLLIIPLLLMVAVAHIVFAIMGAMKANQGEWWRYPVNIRFVKGAV